MRIQIAALADYASISEGNKLNIMGIFAKLYAETVPVRHNEMQLVVQMIFEPPEAGEKHVKIYLEDIDGHLVLQLDGQFVVPPSQDHEPISINQILRLQGIVFPAYGSYEFKIDVDGETKLLSPVNVLPLPHNLPN